MRKATNVSLNTDLLDQARALEINISRACERGLVEQIEEVRAARWREENRTAIVSSNDYVDRKGLPLAGHRRF
jgi:antitoxin CcdA